MCENKYKVWDLVPYACEKPSMGLYNQKITYLRYTRLPF
jgi:hypothetical protein